MTVQTYAKKVHEIVPINFDTNQLWERTLHQPLHSLVLRQVSVKPGEDGVGVDVLVEVSQQVAEHEALVSTL
jgi:hypothetical protein